METLMEDEESRFFDAHEEIASCSGASSDCGIDRIDDDSLSLSGLDSSHSGNFHYDVWIQSPGNARERRNKFLNWMGVSGNQGFHENSANSCTVDSFWALDVSRIRIGENNSGAVLRNSSFGDEFSSGRSSVSSWSNGGSCSELSVSGLRDNLNSIVRENCEVNKPELSKKKVGVSSPCFQYLPSETAVEQRDFGGIMKRVKKKWFSRLKKAHNGRSSEDSDGNGAIFGSRIQRVKVKEYKKQVKELSALYKGQDIQAHEGSILSMKFSPDGKYLASAGEDGVLRVWIVVEDDRSTEHDIPKMDPSCMYFEVNNLSELQPLVLEKEKKRGTLMSPRQSTDSACVIFPPKIFRILEKPIHEFHGHTGDILDISWSKNSHILSASVDKTVRLWQMGCDDCLGVFSHSNYVTSVQFNPVDDNYFISGSIDGKVRIWSVSHCQVIDWADVRDIVTAVCYRPDGQGGIVGTLRSDCRFYNISDNHLQLDAQMCLHRKKRSSNKLITGFQFSPNDPSRVMVVSADSQVRILHGLNVVRKYKGSRNAGNQLSASFTSDGKHIISACDDSTIYVWNCTNHHREDPEPSSVSFSQPKKLKIRSFEKFSADASVAIPWCGFNSESSGRFSGELSPSLFSLGHEFVLDSPKGAATWPEEKLGSSFSPAKAIRRSQYKFLKSSCQRTSDSSHLWGLVIVTGGWDGRIRLFHNYGLPVPV